MTKLDAIAHLEMAMSHNKQFKKDWKQFIEIIIMEELDDLQVRPLARQEAADKISNRVIGLFDAGWWHAQGLK